jgi:hydroxymethylpyrimidine/phosphomethylpyrimidine kinase
MQLPSVVTIAGSDSSGGAGIQADLKTIAALGLYGQSVITALTSQNTCGVRSIQETRLDIVDDQIDAVFEDIRPQAVKIGMLSSAHIASHVASGLARHGAEHIVVDPVMVATSGAALMAQGAAATVVRELFPLAQVVTPNLPEASALAGFDAASRGLQSMVEAARAISDKTAGAVLVKGGHMPGEDCATDVLLLHGVSEPIVLRGECVQTTGTHGTGCTLSSAIACHLAVGLPVEQAVRCAKAYLTACLAAGLDMGRQNGPLDHMAPARWAIPALEKPAAGPCADGRALVVSGSPCAPSPSLVRELASRAKLVVAVDSGADACLSAGVRVDALVGDGDSLSPEALAHVRACNALELGFPMDKDDTDLGLALAWLTGCKGERGIGHVSVLGALGGRVDHELGALGVLARVDGLAVDIVDDAQHAHMLSADSRARVDFGPEQAGCTLSVLALVGPAVLSESGMRWNLDRATLQPLDDLGVSNVIEEEGAYVEVHSGRVLVVVQRQRIQKGSLLA